MKQIVVFDTGAGGRIFAEYFRKTLGNVEVIEVIDAANAPYGNKTASEIARLTSEALRDYLGTDALIVLACNTATAYAIDGLRASYPEQDFVGVEPAIKSAMKLTKNGKILVLATPATLKSARYSELLGSAADGLEIFTPNCAGWARKIDAVELSEQDVVDALSSFRAEDPDAIVIGCTHYLAIPKSIFERIFPGATIYSPLESVAARVKSLLRQQ